MNTTATLWQRATGLARQPGFSEGVRAMLGTMPGIAAWGLVTGVAMVKGGLSVPLAIFMTLVVYAGSAQLAVLPLMAVGAPLWVVWFTAICVNLRFVILSTMWRSFFSHLRRRHRMAIAYFSGDVIYVAFTKRYPEPVKHPQQIAFFWGGAAANWVGWQLPSLAGIFLADQIPLEWGLGFAGVLALMGVLFTMLRDKATWLSCVVAATAAVACFALPLKLNILAAIATAVAAGLLMETAQRRADALRPLPAVRPPDAGKGERHPVLPLQDSPSSTAPVKEAKKAAMPSKERP